MLFIIPVASLMYKAFYSYWLYDWRKISVNHGLEKNVILLIALLASG